MNTIVRIIEPDHGTVFDPACGSAGIFVETGHFIEEEGEEPTSRVTYYGKEKTETKTKLVRMNVAVFYFNSIDMIKIYFMDTALLKS